jgi:cold shock CspA family protein
MGRALLNHRRVRRAASELAKGFEIDETLEDRRGLNAVTPSLTRALVELDRRDEALTYCERALAVAPQSRRLRSLYSRLQSEPVVKRGTVKRIIQHRRYDYRYGFIAPDDGSDDVYCREGFVEFSGLAEGIRVEVEIEQGPKGPRATSIKVIES